MQNVLNAKCKKKKNVFIFPYAKYITLFFSPFELSSYDLFCEIQLQITGLNNSKKGIMF